MIFKIILALYLLTSSSHSLLFFKVSRKCDSKRIEKRQNIPRYGFIEFQHSSLRKHKNYLRSRYLAKKKDSDDFETLKKEIRKTEAQINDCQKDINIASANVLNCTDSIMLNYWIHKEADLRQEEADLIKKLRGQVYDQSGQELWECIENAALSKDEDFLIFPKMIKYIDRDISYKSILIRKDYIELFDVMSARLVIPSSQLAFKRKFVITGTPGIGISTFLFYFIWRILKGNNSSDDIWKNKKIFLQISPTKILHFQGTKTIEYNDGNVASTNMDEDTILVVDMLVPEEPVYCPGIAIILTVPNPTRFKQFLKSPYAITLYMNVWTKEEIMKVWKDSYSDRLTKDKVLSAFEKIGGVIRYVLEKNEEVDNRLNSALFIYQDELKELKKSIGAYNTKDSEISYTLLHYFPIDKYHNKATIEYASIYIASEILSRINSNDIDDAIRLLNTNHCGGLQSFVGIIFEIFVHRFIYEYGLIKIDRLMPKKKLKVNENTNFDKYGVPFSFIINNITVLNKLPITFSLSTDIESIIINDNRYYRPFINNFPSTDSFTINGNNVFIFQITIGETHIVKEKGLDSIVELIKKKFPNRVFEYHLVFICPKGKKNTVIFTQQKIQLSNKNISVSLNNNFNKIGENSKPFVCNQWLAEFDIIEPSVMNVLRLIK